MEAMSAASSGGRVKQRHQRFRLKAAARTLTLGEIHRLTDDEAYERFEKLRFAENGGEPYCPHCGCIAVYRFKVRRLFKCKGCEKQFTLTSGTLFNSRKKSFRDILAGILGFVNPPQGKASLAIADDLGCAPKTAFVFGHKMRLAMADMQAENILAGDVEVDGVFLRGHVREVNMIAERPSQRALRKQRERCIVTVRERCRGGRSRAFFVKTEAAGAKLVPSVVQPAANLITDGLDSWHRFAATFASVASVNHSEGYSIDGVHINGVENQNLRIKRSLRGVYLSLSKAHAQNYADELSWRDDFRETDNGRKMVLLAQRALKMRKSAAKDWVGYWQKRPAA